MYKLLIEDDEGGKTAVSLIRDEITIGRKEGNTIRLTDRNVSRRHGRIVREDDKIFIEDVAARYGIKKNGQRINSRTELEEGDVVLIGDYRLTLQADTKGANKKNDKSAAGPPPRPGANDFVADQGETTQILQTLPAKLVVVSSNFAGEEFPLSQPEMVIGRGDDCHIIIDHRSISQKHAKIVREDHNTYKIVDLNSKNGVKVSGESYRATHLKRGDVVELGHVKFRFVEPGENYVFQPQDQSPEAGSVPVASTPVGASSGLDANKIGLVAGAIVAAVVVLGGIVLFTSGNGEEQPAVVADSEHESVGVVTQEDREEIEAIEDSADFNDTIAAARTSIEQGELQRPIGRLETILEVADNLSADQESEIEDLLRKAQNEIPFKRSFEEAKKKLADGDALAALDEASAIPPHSLFHQRMTDDGTLDEIFEAVLDEGYDALGNRDFDGARELADEVLMVSADYAPAEDLLNEIEDAEHRIEVAALDRGQNRGTTADNTGSRQQDTGSTTTTTTTTPSPPRGLTAEQAREKYNEAARKFAAGQPRETINICGEALRAGHTDCHRLMGLAYSRLGDTVNACSHFERYMASGPSNPGPVQNQMDNLGCGE